MTNHRSTIHAILRNLDTAFEDFERGRRGRLFDSRDALVTLAKEVENGGWSDVVPLCELVARTLSRVLREGALSERSVMEIVREMLALVEDRVTSESSGAPGAATVEDGVGGVFRVVNESKIGDMLVKMGKLHPAQVHQALVLQRVSKDRRFGEVLVAMNAIDSKTLEDALDAQHTEAKSKPLAPSSGSELRLAPIPDLPPLQPQLRSTATRRPSRDE